MRRMAYCTLFDRSYLVKGVLMISSLAKTLPYDSSIEVLALGSDVQDKLISIGHRWYPQLHVVRYQDFSTPALEEKRKGMSHAEFCWMLASQFTFHVADQALKNGVRGYAHPEAVAYVDADCYWFGWPSHTLQRWDEADVAITPHRWTPKYADRLRVNGIFNVGYVYFRVSRIGLECLETWKRQVWEWCRAVPEAGKFADQAYLNDWPERWGARVIEHPGVNLAPWNQEQYEYDWNPMRDCLMINAGGKHFVHLVMYHFHEYQARAVLTAHNPAAGYTGYPVAPEVVEHVYRPYTEKYARMERYLESL